MKSFFTTILFGALWFNSVFGQTYLFEAGTEDYQPLVSAASMIDEPWDDPEIAFPLGFDFLHFDELTQHLLLSESLASIALLSNLDFQTLNMILPMSADLKDRGYEIDSMMSPILFQVSGSAGSRVATIEFREAGFWNGELADGILVDHISFQIKIFEGSGDVEIHWGPSSVTLPELDFEGNPGPAVGMLEGFDLFFGTVNGEVLLLSGDGADPQVHTEYQDVYVTWPIPENTVYRFYRMTIGNNDPLYKPEQTFFYPNPAKDKLYVRAEYIADITSEVKLFDADGKYRATIEDISNISLSHLSAGHYFISFTTPKGRVIEKITLVE